MRPLSLQNFMALQNFIALAAWGCASCLILQSTAAQNPPDDFSHNVLPIIKRHCGECHMGSEAKGGFSMNRRSLWLESGHVDLAVPSESYVLELITSVDQSIQMPPPERSRLSAEEVGALRAWISGGMRWPEGVQLGATYEPPLRPRTVVLPESQPGLEHPIDRIVNQYWEREQFNWPAAASDRVFYRRVSLDLLGLLPTPGKLDAFVNDQSPGKRVRLIQTLLDDRQAYAEHWLTFYNDLLRNDYSGTGFITGGRRQITKWLYESLLENKPFDQFARELIAPPDGSSRGFIDGIKWRGEVSAGQTLEIQFAQSVSQAFLGINLKCASCHDSFIDRWKLDDAYGLAAVYAERPLELHRCDIPTGQNATARWLFPELGQIDAMAVRDVRLNQLAELMTDRQNGRFARTIVNRFWQRLMGRGIVHPLDAMQQPPWNDDLLDYLADFLVKSNYDVKAVLELIATSRVYQLRVAAQGEVREGSPFAGPRSKRMTAEQFLDAVWQVTGAGPTAYDADVIRGGRNQDEGKAEPLQHPAHWIWDSDGLRAPGGQVRFFHRTLQIEGDIEKAVAVVSCDNEYQLFVNRKLVAEGKDWARPAVIRINGWLKQGNNELAIVAKNGAEQPNPAGLFFTLRIDHGQGPPQFLSTDSLWKVYERSPTVKEGRLAKHRGNGIAATELAALGVWSRAVDSVASKVQQGVVTDDAQLVRASLLKNDRLMRALGRPHREQIVSMRPEELTTIEAIDLANEPGFAGTLESGAGKLLQQEWTSRDELIEYLFQYSLSRAPEPNEHRQILDAWSEQPTIEELQDTLWAIFMLPEFVLVR